MVYIGIGKFLRYPILEIFFLLLCLSSFTPTMKKVYYQTIGCKFKSDF